MSNLEELMGKMEKGPDDFASAIRGVSDAILSRRPDGKNWAAKEIICHMRDTEEIFITRLKSVIAMDEPKFIPPEMERWAEERQYMRNDIQGALSAFRKRRTETLKFFGELKPEQWDRAGIHPTRGRQTLRDLLGIIANHDPNHLEQLKRALAGQA